MCGLAGLLSPSSRPDLAETARTMTRLLRHRGPDGFGVWSDVRNNVHLGHTRLAVQDLSEAGAQPMTSACGRFSLVLNGEIYNHLELRRGFGSNHPWRGHSDTETLLAGIAHFGLEATLPLLNGMFALAVWDAERRELALARDRVGEKPLYWGEVRGSFVFGSEMRAILRSGLGPFHVEEAAIPALLNLGYIPDPLSIIQGIHKLEPGHWLRVRSRDRYFEVEKGIYWSLEAEYERAARETGMRSDEEWLEAVDAGLRESVRQRLISDVPVGAFLSGGVDSGLIVAQMAELSAPPVRTFTVAMPGASDESPRARTLADHLGTDHTEIPIREVDCLGVVPNLPRIYGEPFGDSSQVPTLVVSEAARKYVTVVLSGDGGDELFAGYHRHFAAQAIWHGLRKAPLGVRRAAEGIVRTRAGRRVARAAIDAVTGRGRQVDRHLRLHKGLRLLGAESARALYERLVVQWPQGQAPLAKAQVWSPALPTWVEAAVSLEVVERFGAYDLLTALPGDMLVKVDRASMAHALEVRVPFLDHDFIALSLQVPVGLKTGAGQGKLLLRRLLARRAPAGWMEQPQASKKIGFGVPLAQWLRGELRDWAEALLTPEALDRSPLWDSAEVQARWHDFQSDGGPWEHPLWSVLSLQAWLDEYEDVLSWA